MKVKLNCSNNLRPILVELLRNRDIEVVQEADLAIVEKGCQIDEQAVSIVFDMSTMDKLMKFLDEKAGSHKNSKVISGKSDTGYEVLNYQDICYFEGIGNHVFAVNDHKKFKVKEKLYELEDKLGSQGFIRVSKAFVVNITKIDKISPWFNGKLLLKMVEPEIEIDVTRKYVKDFKSFLGI